MTKRTRFITVEGIEGAGKSSHVDHIADVLRATGATVLVTREPGGTALGARLRTLLLEDRGAAVDPLAELLLMFADRAQHLAEQIVPALEHGSWVVCDRFTDSTIAYQGAGRGLPPADIATLERLVQRGLRPGLTLLLDLPASVGRQRARGRSRPDRIEASDDAFFERVRRGFLTLAGDEPNRIKVVDAERSMADVRGQIETYLTAYLSTVGEVQ